MGNSNRDAFVPWWTMDGGGGDGACAIPNGCGGCSVLAREPGTPCGACGGVYVCDGTDAVVCDDPCSDEIGCSDGGREGFLDTAEFYNIAACAGGWSISGILNTAPQCNHLSGDDSTNPSGLGCSAADICAEGWHVCNTLAEIAAATSVGCNYSWDPDTFFVAAVSGPGGDECNTDGTDDLFGCGSVGRMAAASCDPLNRASGDKCQDLPSQWECPGGLFGSTTEAEDVKKNSAVAGGVLCCRDNPGPPPDGDAGVPDGG
jgi:hypothetical protein